ncbi:MAG: hypothetical protein JWN40_5298 [Phycisphaerales bacterium]|nr:hypothetical protein [Phycisphaerales bacterium]
MRLLPLMRLLSFLLCLAQATAAPAGSPFVPLGALDGPAGTSAAFAIAPDGSAVYGTSSRSADGRDGFRWTRAAGMTPLNLGDLGANGYVRGASVDGNVVVGTRTPVGGFSTAFVASSGIVTSLAPLPGYTDVNLSANAISGDGSVVVGMQIATDPMGRGSFQAVRWVNGLPASLGTTGNGELRYSLAYGISRDGTTVVGGIATSTLADSGFRWTQATGIVPLGRLPGYTYSTASVISADNSIITGTLIRDVDGDGTAEEYQAARYVNNTIQLLGDLPGGPLFSVAHAVSADGSVVVGRSAVGGTAPEGDDRAFIWDAAHGMRDLADVLTGLGADLAGWKLTIPRAISDDGFTIAGVAINPAGREEAFVATVPEPGAGAAAAVLAFMAMARRATPRRR